MARYTRGDNRALIVAEATAHGWTVSQIGDTMSLVRRESNILMVWTVRDTVTYASLNMQGSAGRIPARPRMALVQAREWISAPGEPI